MRPQGGGYKFTEALTPPPRFVFGLRFEAALCVLIALSDLSHRIRSLGNGILELDVGRKSVLFLTYELQHLFDRSVPLAPGNIGAVVFLSVLQVEIGNAGMVLLNERDGIVARRREVPDIEIHANVFAQ